MGLVRNLPDFLKAVDLSFTKVRQMSAHQYRAFVWSVFLRILEHTPQSTGRAVANWNIGVNEPDLTFDASLGDKNENPLYGTLRQQGDPKWIEVAKNRNKARVWGPGGGPRIGFKQGGLTYKDRVYITNLVKGDDDDGEGGYAYLEALQDPEVAFKTLRAVNLPYENAQESVIVVATKMLGRGFSLPNVSGGTWQ